MTDVIIAVAVTVAALAIYPIGPLVLVATGVVELQAPRPHDPIPIP